MFIHNYIKIRQLCQAQHLCDIGFNIQIFHFFQDSKFGIPLLCIHIPFCNLRKKTLDKSCITENM